MIFHILSPSGRPAGSGCSLAAARSVRQGKLAILVATDVASRGIDVDDVECVINYDIPEENEY